MIFKDSKNDENQMTKEASFLMCGEYKAWYVGRGLSVLL